MLFLYLFYLDFHAHEVHYNHVGTIKVSEDRRDSGQDSRVSRKKVDLRV